MNARLISLVLLVLLVGAGCANAKSAGENPSDALEQDEANEAPPTQLRASLRYFPETFDPGSANDVFEQRLLFNLFEGLLTPAPTTSGANSVGDLVRPGVAKSYGVSHDGKTYTFRLRNDARWSNGDAVTAEDFVFAWKRVLTPGSPADFAPILYVIDGAEAYHRGKTDDWSSVGVEATDSHTLVVELVSPTPVFPELVSFYTFFPVPKKVVEKHGNDWVKPENLVTNGAYKLRAASEGELIQLTKDPLYWDREDVWFDRVTFRIIPDYRASIQAFAADELDWICTLPQGHEQVEAEYAQPILGTYFVRVNVDAEESPAPLQNPEVRRALLTAIDREKVLEQATKGRNRVAQSFVPPQMPTYEASKGARFDPNAARKLLADAGYPGGEGIPKLTYVYNDLKSHERIARVLQEMWRKELGIEVDLVALEWPAYLSAIERGEYHLARAGWSGDYHDPSTFLDLMSSASDDNHTGWLNSSYDTLIAKARGTADTTERALLYQKAEELLLNEAPIIPIYFYSSFGAISPNIEGFAPHSRDIHLIKYMSANEAR